MDIIKRSERRGEREKSAKESKAASLSAAVAAPSTLQSLSLLLSSLVQAIKACVSQQHSLPAHHLHLQLPDQSLGVREDHEPSAALISLSLSRSVSLPRFVWLRDWQPLCRSFRSSSLASLALFAVNHFCILDT